MYTNEIQAGIDRLDALDKEVAKEKEIQSHLDSDLRRGEKRNQNIRVRSANLRNRDGKKLESDIKLFYFLSIHIDELFFSMIEIGALNHGHPRRDIRPKFF